MNTLLITANAQHDHKQSADSNNKAFELIKMLEGEWRGNYAWTGLRKGEGSAHFIYIPTGGGTSIMEHFMNGDSPFMTTVYHLDGADIRATHFCATNNHPRFKAGGYNEGENSIRFAFVDITNFTTPEIGHVSSIEITFVSDNEIVINWEYTSSKGESNERIELNRVNN